MALLTEDIKRTIVMELAMWRTPSEVTVIVEERYGVKIDRRQVFHYDPDGCEAPKIAEKWKVLHKATRGSFVKEASSIPIATRAFRLRELGDIYRRAKQMNNYALAAQMLEQAAKDVGEGFTKRREHTGKDGAPLFAQMTDDQLEARYQALLAGSS